MLRRNFLKSVPPVLLMPQLRSATRLKITDIRIVNLKVVRETGKMEAAWNPGTVTVRRIGGGSVIEIHTDQGLTGIGPAIDNGALESSKAQLVGKDPFSIEELAGPLRYYLGQTRARLRVWRLRYGTSSARPPGNRSINSGARPRTGCRPMPA
jgi:hypothetical protein